MKTIVYKNGIKQGISQETANKLKHQILKGCNNFQIFEDENENLNFMINVSEIVAILS